ncbi:TetR/AcrR family transcriptional regulator [Actinomadura barringtoniae]|uniref:TetR/AcrR family transcriptional regulator n=1 Tax=Actinomadura barringtoniae TaxID=1427535 RepID=A0A939P7X2_9ACTN|nr:TetR/AcrR family transcriptional regulator [Actinomadura barringtoniae]MBO2447350.1 TetR/AcrR family transcriptional regulator [Actinomadura barringtoniae]
MAGLRATKMRQTRRRLLDAARRRMIDTGYHGLSLEQVAEDAEVTRVTVYRHFGSKLGLLEAVADDLADRSEVVPRMREAAAITDASDAFRAMVAELCRFWSTDPDLFRRLVGLAAVDPEARHVVADREQWRYEQIAAFVRRLDVRPPFDTAQAAVAVGAMTAFPACDDMSVRLGVELTALPDLLLPPLTGIIHLRPPQ